MSDQWTDSNDVTDHFVADNEAKERAYACIVIFFKSVKKRAFYTFHWLNACWTASGSRPVGGNSLCFFYYQIWLHCQHISETIDLLQLIMAKVVSDLLWLQQQQQSNSDYKIAMGQTIICCKQFRLCRFQHVHHHAFERS